MGRVYFLIDTDSGMASGVAKALSNRLCVSLVDAVAGPHDVIAVLEGIDSKSVADMTLADIRAIDGVKYVTTCISIRASG